MLKNNEKGSTLVMVLLIAVIITILGASLFAMNMSASKQFTNKEEQVQARHLAEMGVMHYHAAVGEEVRKHNEKEPEKYYKGSGKDIVFDEEKTREEHTKKLCRAIRDIEMPTYQNSSAHTYNIVGKDTEPLDCNHIIFSTNELSINIKSTGQVDGTKRTDKVIAANVGIKLKSGEKIPDSGEDDDEDLGVSGGGYPEKPGYPEDWASKLLISNLDQIGEAQSAKVNHSITNQEPFETSAFVEFVGAVNIDKKSMWTFQNHLLILGSAIMNTGGANLSILDVGKDLYIGSAFDSVNHNKVKVGGDLIIEGAVQFGTDFEMTIEGNALFSYETANDFNRLQAQPHSTITIHKNAYFKSPASSKAKEERICVKGNKFLWKGNDWKPYTSSDRGYQVFAKAGSCSTDTSLPPSDDPYKWEIKEEVNADYFSEGA